MHTTNKISTVLEKIAQMVVNLVTSHMTPYHHRHAYTHENDTRWFVHKPLKPSPLYFHLRPFDRILTSRHPHHQNHIINWSPSSSSYHVILVLRIFSSADITCSHEFFSPKILVRDSEPLCTTHCTMHWRKLSLWEGMV